MEATVHMGWLTAGVAVFSGLLGFVGASLTMFKIQGARCEKQRGECAAALALRVESYKAEFARRDVLSERFRAIEQSLNEIKKTVDFLARQTGFFGPDFHRVAPGTDEG